MWRVLLCLAILQIVHSSCPDGWDLTRNGQCRGLVARTADIPDNQMGDTPVKKCKDIGAQPVIIHNHADHFDWAQTESPTQLLILGLVCNFTTHRWEWGDGSAVDYKYRNEYDSALDSTCSTTCVWYMTWDWYWANSCDTDPSPDDFYCTKQLPPLPVPAGGECASFAPDDEDGVCYQIGTFAENWQDAQSTCQRFGANLASIHNLQENAFIRRMAVSQNFTHGVFIGANNSGTGTSYGWIDGSKWDYDNYVPGFPKAGLGDCIAMDTSTTDGQWKNIDCSSKLPVVCMREKNQNPAVDLTCHSDSWKEGSIITSPGFPYSAFTPCDYYLTVDPGKRVEVEISFLEANSCCDQLIVYDGYFGGYMVATLTGEVANKTFTTTSSNVMLVSWQPDEALNVRGFVMSFRGV